MTRDARGLEGYDTGAKPGLPYNNNNNKRSYSPDSLQSGVCVCLCVCACLPTLQTGTNILVHACMHTYIHTCIHTSINVYMHTYIHTYIHT